MPERTTTIRTVAGQVPLRRWRDALFVVFAGNGLAISTWMSRVPDTRDALGATTGRMGWIGFAMAVGSIAGLTCASHALAVIGSRRTIAGVVTIGSVGLGLAGVGASALASTVLVVVGLGLLGFGMGTCDVAMNVEGAANERALGRTVMPWFHAAFSAGTVAGAGLGALADLLGLPTGVHFGVVAALVTAATIAAVPRLRIDAGTADDSPAAPTGTWRDRLAMWSNANTLLIGLLVLGMAFAEGAANDWLPLAMVDGHGVTNSVGAVVFGVFVAMMTVGRIAGVALLDRYGRVPVLRATALLAGVGIAVVIFAPSAWLAVVGVVFWGVGASLGFPVGMSAAADDSRTAAARVSVVVTIGYLAFLAGPPAIGVLGDHVGLLHALLVVLVLVASAGLVSPAARER